MMMGLQLNIGGRGLDPNRTSNFNTETKWIHISADVLVVPKVNIPLLNQPMKFKS